MGNILRRAVRETIERNMETSLSLTDAKISVLTELVGDGVMDEQTRTYILAGSTTGEANQRLLKWFNDNPSSFDIFLMKLQHRQNLAANKLNELPGHSVQQQELVPHADTLKKHSGVLLRCTDINIQIIAELRSISVIDDSMTTKLKAENDSTKRIEIIYNWLKHQNSDAFNNFIDVMNENEQKHVVNLLTNNSQGQQPMSVIKYERLRHICPKLMKGIVDSSNLFANVLSGDRDSEETDYAISSSDYEDITQGHTTDSKRYSALIDAVLRRTDFSFDSLQKVLRDKAHEHMADLMTEGEVVGTHIKTTHPGREEALANGLTEIIHSPSSLENREIADGVEELNSYNLHMVAAEPLHSIMVYTYCRRPDDMKCYVKLLNCGRLKIIFENILNGLLKIIEPDISQKLEATLTLEEDDKQLIKDFTGLDVLDQLLDIPDDGGDDLQPTEKDEDLPEVDSFNKQEHVQVAGDDGFEGNREDEEIHLQELSNKKLTQIRSTMKQVLFNLKELANFANTMLHPDELIAFFKMLSNTSSNELNTLLKTELKKLLGHVRDKDVECLRKDEIHQQKSGDDARNSFFASVGQTLAEISDNYQEPSSINQRCDRFEHTSKGERLPSERCPVPDSGESSPSERCLIPCSGEGSPPEIRPVCEKGYFGSVNIEENMKNLKSQLIALLEPDFGLLDKLLRRRALTRSDEGRVMSGLTTFYRNEELLELIFQKGKYDDLMAAMTENNQRHLVNFVKANGEYRAEFQLDWPLMEKEKDILNDNRDTLLDVLDTTDLVNMLLSERFLNIRQREFISSKPTGYDRNKAFLDILRQSSLAVYYKTIECLQASNQSHVAKIFESGGTVVKASASLNLESLEQDLVERLANLILDNERPLELLATLQLNVIAARRGT